MQGYKGFDENLKCRGFQYEIGKTATHDKKVSLCNQGLHFCENPLDVLAYYAPANSRFAEVEADAVSEQKDSDSKRAAASLHIKAELSLSALLGAGVKFILGKVDWKNAKESNTGDSSAATNTGNRSAATNTGNRSAATNTGDRSAATNTGYRSAATNTGNSSAATNTGDSSAATNTGSEGCAISLGIAGVARGAIGCWLTIAEWKQDKSGLWHRADVKTVKVDGKKIKPNTFYKLSRGKFVKTTWGQ